MNIRTKFLISFLLIAIIAMIGNHLVDVSILRPSYQQIEIDNGHKRLERLEEAINQDLANLNQFNSDWAIWDDSYYYLKNKNNDFIDKNMASSTFENANLSSILFYDLDLNFISGKLFSEEENRFIPIDECIFYFNARDVIKKIPADQDSFTALLKDHNKIIMFSVQKIYDTHKKYPSNGFIVMAKHLDNNYWERLAKQTVYKFHVVKQDETSTDLRKQLSKASTNKISYINSDMESIGHLQLHDYNNKPIFILSTSLKSDILKLGQKAIATSSQITIFIMIISFIILAFIFEMNFFRRIKKIQQTVGKIQNNSEDLKKRLNDSGNDEISALVKSINNMLSAIQNANFEKDELQKNLFASSKNSSIAELAGGIAHEINNPLAILQMSLDDLKTVCAHKCNYHKIKDFFDIHSQTISRIATIARYLMDYTKQEDQIDEICNPHDLIQKTLDLVIPVYSQNSIIFVKRLEALEPEIKISRKNFQTVLLNIFSNAKESFQVDQAQKIITIEDRYNFKGDYELIISDNGKGISDDNLPRIFDNFYTTYPTKKSLGLGLPLTQNLILKASGSIRVDSKINQGTIVTMTFLNKKKD